MEKDLESRTEEPGRKPSLGDRIKAVASVCVIAYLTNSIVSVGMATYYTREQNKLLRKENELIRQAIDLSLSVSEKGNEVRNKAIEAILSGDYEKASQLFMVANQLYKMSTSFNWELSPEEKQTLQELQRKREYWHRNTFIPLYNGLFRNG